MTGILTRERTDLSDDDLAHLHALVAEWSLLADLAFSDLVLWVPTWNEAGYVAVAQVRPTTGPTSQPEDLVGEFSPRGRWPQVERATLMRAPVTARDPGAPAIPVDVEAFPVVRAGRVLAVVTRHSSRSRPSMASDDSGPGVLEDVYLRSFDDLARMMSDGDFPYPERLGATDDPPRVGDGLLRLSPAGVVEFASPNAVSAFHRLGLAVDLVGAPLTSTVSHLKRRPGAADESLSVVAAGSASGEAEVDNGSACVTLRALPLRRGASTAGSLVLARDVTDLRRRDRALLTKDATIREIHHRVKNNLQTVAALLRMQARRVPDGESRAALDEAVRRVGAIAVVHEALALTPGEVVDFDQVMDRVVALASDAASSGGGRVVAEGSVGLWPAERATSVAMALTELLMNAVEHGLAGGEGTVTVHASRTSEAVELVVTDDGRGFSPEAETSTGLGLQIVQTLVVDDLGGTVDLGPFGGPGSRVTLLVPSG